MTTPAQTVSEFHPEHTPPGTSARYWVQLTRDALHQPVAVPMLVARGRKPGPVFGFTAVVHGNELNGLRVLQSLFQKLDPQQLKGTVAAVLVANPSALHAQTRETARGFDINKCFPGDLHGHSASQWNALLLSRIVSRFDRLVDLHTASFGRVNSLYVRADMSNALAADMAYLQRPQIVLHNPPNDATLRGAAAALDIPAITVEIGNPHRFQPDYIRRALVGLRALLCEAGMLRRRKRVQAPPPVLCASSEWLYTHTGGLLDVKVKLATLVQAGQPIATLRNAFGDLLHTYEAPKDGVVIGHSINPAAETGARIVHLGHVVSPEDRRFSRLGLHNAPAPELEPGRQPGPIAFHTDDRS